MTDHITSFVLRVLQAGMNGFNTASLQDAVFDIEQEMMMYSQLPGTDAVTEILAELSNHNERSVSGQSVVSKAEDSRVL